MRQRVSRGWVTTFRTLGTGASPHNLWTAEVAAASGHCLVLRRLSVSLDATVVLTAVMPQVKLSRPTALPTGGTVLTAGLAETLLPLPASVLTFRGANASDGGGATAITSTAGVLAGQTYVARLHTAVGQVIGAPAVLFEAASDDEGLRLRPGEAALVQVIANPVTSNPATNHWLVSVSWALYTDRD